MTTNSSLLNGMVVFAHTIESGSFTSAAAQLGHSTSYISKEITKLEARLGVRLINRTTRSINLTAAGKTYYERCQQIIIDAKNAELAMSSIQETPKGVLKVSAPVSFGISHINQLLPTFLERYPDVDLDINYSERKVDLVAEGYDVAIRVGELKDSNLIAKKLGRSKGVIVTSPEYIEKYGEPQTPAELQHHRVVSYSNVGTPRYWELTDEKGKKIGVNVNPRVISNNAELEVLLAHKSIAISRIPKHFCLQELQDGKLIQILKQYHENEIGIYAVYPHRQYLSAKVDVFVKFLEKMFSEHFE